MSNMFSTMKNNPMLQLLKNSQNPNQAIMNICRQKMGNNPMLQYILNLAQSNNSAQIETIARNLLQEAGLDPDETYNNFSNYMKSN